MSARQRLGVLLALQVTGLLAGLAIIAAAARRQSAPERRLVATWLNATRWPWAHLSGAEGTRVLVLGLVVLVVCWLGVVALHRGTRPGPPWLAPVGVAVWCLPFALTVPILSRDVYAYVGQGLLVLTGRNPYAVPVSHLVGHPAAVAAVDPVWRGTLTPYGPLALRIEEVAAWAGGGVEWRSLLVLRLFACLALLVTLGCLWQALPERRRSLGLWLAASPLVVLHLLAAAHLDAIVCALLAVAVLLVRRGRTDLAVVPAVLAGEVKATAFVVVAALLLPLLIRTTRPVVTRALVLTTVTLVAGGGMFVADPLGWLSALATPGRAWDPFTPAVGLSLVGGHLMSLLGGPSGPLLLSGFRVAAETGGALVALGLLLTARRRSPLSTGALMLLVVCLAGPVLWPWYLTAAVPLLLLADARWARPAAVSLGALGALLAVPLAARPAQRLAFTAELTLVVAIAVVIIREHADVTFRLRRATAFLVRSASGSVGMLRTR